MQVLLSSLMASLSHALNTSVIFVIAGGPSAKGVDGAALMKLGFVIGVNDSALETPCHAAFTMDRLWFENRREQLTGKLCFLRHTVYDRYIANYNPWIGLYRIPMMYDKTQLSTGEEIHGNNSGFCAFDFAMRLSPKKIFLIGFDMSGANGSIHWYPNYEWTKDKTNDSKYKGWARWFDESAEECQKRGVLVYNCSESSRISGFPKIPLADIPKYLEVS